MEIEICHINAASAQRRECYLSFVIARFDDKWHSFAILLEYLT